MKIVIAGGNGYLGKLLVNEFKKEKENIIYILTRTQQVNIDNVHFLCWDGVSKGYWTQFLEGADVLINLAGTSVNCSYTVKNKKAIYQSRIDSTSLLCKVVQRFKHPPKVFIQTSSATIYKHSEKKLMKEKDGDIGTDFSMDVCKKWEAVFNTYRFPKTKKIITRTAIVLGNKGGAFPLMKRMAKFGLGGRQGKGSQFISWVTERDYVRAIKFLINKEEGIYNLCVPNPIRNVDFQKKLRRKLGVYFYINLPYWLLKIGAIVMRTETELLLKSRKVFPEKLLQQGFQFEEDQMDSFYANIFKK
ncbi:TIGR01777 family oxidoreductase [Tenacibaculum maritimum]|uniref:TIGR01777 family oxidoreductase n=1 Tax=Tenacibaculum maritimum TaxID=107401 RepID=UPI00388ED0E3